jgi:hypothetical protein
MRDGELWVVDLGSINGIAVNGQRSLEQKVRDGDELTVGLVRFRINTGEDPTGGALKEAPPVKLSRMHTAVLDPTGATWIPRLTLGDSGAEKHLVVLLELCRALQARLPVHEITQRLLDLLERALPFGGGCVVLVDSETGKPMQLTKLPRNQDADLDASAGLQPRFPFWPSRRVDGSRACTGGATVFRPLCHV